MVSLAGTLLNNDSTSREPIAAAEVDLMISTDSPVDFKIYAAGF